MVVCVAVKCSCALFLPNVFACIFFGCKEDISVLEMTHAKK